MSFKLIREATVVATLSESEIRALAAMKTGAPVSEAADEKMELWTADSGNYDVHHPERHKSIGHYKTQGEARAALDASPNKKMMGPIHKVAGYASWLKKNVTESFSPSDTDFETWMRVIVGEAGDRGVNLNKKSEFMQLTMDVLENDPASPPIDMQEMIASKLWQDYNSAKNAVRINKLAKAKEEEEKVELARKQIADRYAQGPDATSQLMKNSIANDEEEMGISDDLAARKIFNKIKGTPNLNFATIQQYVNKYIGMVGKAPTDAKYISTLVYSMVQDAGMEEEEVADFVKKGGTIQQIPSRKPRAGEKWQGSAHIGKGSDRPGRVTTGKAANTKGLPVVGMRKKAKEDEESGFAQALRASIGMEDEESDEPRLAYGKRDWEAEAEQYPGDGYRAHRAAGGTLSQDDWDFDRSQSNTWDDEEDEWYDEQGRPDPNGAYDAGGHLDMERFVNNGDEDYLKDQAIHNSFEDEEPSFVRDALRDTSSMKGSFSSHLRGDDEFDDEDDMEISFGPEGVEGVSDDEVFTSDDDECECSCDDETDSEDIEADGFDDTEADGFDDTEAVTPEDELDDETMDDVDADVEPRAPKKGFDEEEAVKSFFRQAVTSPNDMMRKAVKDIEDEGKAAWQKSNVPSNPHPKKSQAYRAWQKGLTNAAKEALGIVDKPVDKPKPKRKK